MNRIISPSEWQQQKEIERLVKESTSLFAVFQHPKHGLITAGRGITTGLLMVAIKVAQQMALKTMVASTEDKNGKGQEDSVPQEIPSTQEVVQQQSPVDHDQSADLQQGSVQDHGREPGNDLQLDRRKSDPEIGDVN